MNLPKPSIAGIPSTALQSFSKPVITEQDKEQSVGSIVEHIAVQSKPSPHRIKQALQLLGYESSHNRLLLSLLRKRNRKIKGIPTFVCKTMHLFLFIYLSPVHDIYRLIQVLNTQRCISRLIPVRSFKRFCFFLSPVLSQRNS